MQPSLAFAFLATGLLSSDVAAAAVVPEYFRPQARADEAVCPPPPTPKVTWFDGKELAKLALPLMPAAQLNGEIRLPSFQPKEIDFIGTPKTIDFKDPHFDVFSKIAPDSQRIFLRRQVEPSNRMLRPFTMIGKVFMRDGPSVNQCTGTMVGARLFLTANHCVQNKTSGWSLEFVPGFVGAAGPQPRAPFGIPILSEECWGIRRSDDPIKSANLDGSDYVVCVLKESVGTRLGFTGPVIPKLGDEERTYMGQSWFSAGYPASFQDGKALVLEDTVKILKYYDTPNEGKTLVSDPYPDHGWSGGPLYGLRGNDAYLIGVVSAVLHVSVHETIFQNALHSGGARLSHLVQVARCKWFVMKDVECPESR